MKGEELNFKIKSDSRELQDDIDKANIAAKKLKNTISEIEKNGGKGSEEWKKYKLELQATENQAKKLASELKNMDVSTMSMRQMEIYVKSLNKEWKAMNPASQEAIAQLKKIGEVEKQMKLVADQAAKIKAEAMGLAQPGVWSNIKSMMANAFSIASVEMILNAVVNFTREAVLMAASVSDAFGNIRKSTGMTTQEVVDLNKAIHQIDTRTAQKDLLDIAKVGGQISVAKDEMLGFVKSVDMASVALSDEFKGGAEEVANTIGTLSKLFKETKDLDAGKAVNDIGSAINELGAAGRATGPVMADFATRIGSLKMAPKISETLGYAAALQELGLSSEISASGLSNILLTSAKATAEFAKQIGVTEVEFKRLLNSDPNTMLIKLAASFRGLPTEVVVQQMDALGIKSQEATKVMMLLSDKTEMVKEKQELAAKAMKEGTSLVTEFGIKNNTAAAQLEKAGKMVDYIKESLGTFLIPVLLLATTGFVGLLKAIAAVPEFIVENKELFIGLGAAILTLNGANILAAGTAIAHAAAEKGRAIATQSSAIAAGLLTAAMKANPIGIMIAVVVALAGAFMTLYNRSETVRAGVAALWAGLSATGTVIAQFAKALISMDFAGMAKAISEGGKSIGDAFMKGYSDKLASESPKVVDKHKDTVDKKGKVSKDGADQAAIDEVNAATGSINTIDKAHQKANDKRVADRKKLLEIIAQNEAEFERITADNAVLSEEAKIQEKRRKRLKEVDDIVSDEKTKEAARVAINKAADAEIFAVREKDNKKALELIASLEAEYDQKSAKNSLEVETLKIEEKRRKRLADVVTSAADEETKVKIVAAIHAAADASLEKAADEFRLKKQKADDDAAKKKVEADNFIRDQERKAEASLYEWKLQEAKGNADKIATIKKEQVDVELRLTKEKLTGEMEAEKVKASILIKDTEELSTVLADIEEKHRIQNVLADRNAADERLKIDRDLNDQKAANLQGYSDAFYMLLEGNVVGAISAASEILSVDKAQMDESTRAMIEKAEKVAAFATQGVAFLNKLAQEKAEKAIAEANRERDAKVALLENEMLVNDALITASSNYVTALKEAETNRLAELQRILTSETATEEQKRDALKAYYSQQLQQMKAAEEAKIEELQRLANLAKTDDEKRAIEAKIELAKQESAEKIRLAEEDLSAKKANINELSEFTTEVTESALSEANTASEKQILMASDEAEMKAQFKEDLEETIAAENRKARAIESVEKKKAFEAQKKADIATALITGALAVLKALANFFPLNIILAATAAVTTGVQIAKIKSQATPAFADGGVYGQVVRGGKHGTTYGTGGIALIDRSSGMEVGEMEGDEAIVSARQTSANWPILQAMFQNARTPGKADTPVVPLNSLATPMAFRDGGKFESSYFERGMYLFGSKKKKAAAAAAAAEAEAASYQADADAAMGNYNVDTSAYDGLDATDPSSMGDTAAASAAHAAAEKQGQEQLQAIKDLLESSVENGNILSSIVSKVGEVKQGVNGVESAVHSVRDAVNNSNTHGKFDTLISAISNLSAA